MGQNELRKLPDRGALVRYADVIQRLEKAADGELGRSLDLDWFFALPEYDEALQQTYAFGLVGGGLSASTSAP